MPRPTPAMEAPGITKPMQGAAEAKTSMDPRLAAARCSIPPRRLRLSDPYTSRVNCANEPRPVCPPTSSPQATVQNEGWGADADAGRARVEGATIGTAWRRGTASRSRSLCFARLRRRVRQQGASRVFPATRMRWSIDAVCPQDCQEWCASQAFLIGRSLQGRSPLRSVRNGARLRRSSLDKVCRDNPPLQCPVCLNELQVCVRMRMRVGVTCNSDIKLPKMVPNTRYFISLY